jgi:formylglycine-generating enzyme required for sulfatase activity
MGKCEVTWNEFELFMYPTEEKRIRSMKQVDAKLNAITDASSRPTQPYVEMSFGMGKDGFPAISMTQHSANKYCEWLSAKTGHFYRLPTEAEWEYAARAGTQTAYFWGDDASKVDEYCWWAENSEGKYQKVGKKKPNPWGLHDILGNVMEWTLDQYTPTAYASAAPKNPWTKATKPYPHVARGGAWDDDSADKLRVANRRFSDPDWKIQDPQFPKSIWYHTDAQFLGFRVVRPLEVPSAEEMQKYWNSGVEKE